MAHYLVVAHQTASSPLLLDRAGEIARDDADAVFTLLVPETHIGHRFTCDEVQTREVARQRGREAHSAFERAGMRVRDVVVGDPSPVLAIEDELRARPGIYDAIVLSTLPRRTSRWLRLDVPERVAAKFSLPVLHVVEGGEGAWQATEPARRELARGGRPVLPGPRQHPRRTGLAGSWLYAAVVLLLAVHLGFTALLITGDRGLPAGGVLLLASVALGAAAVLGERRARRSPGGEATGGGSG